MKQWNWISLERVEHELFLVHCNNIQSYITLIFVLPSTQHHYTLQVDCLRVWDAPFSSSGQVAIGACTSSEPEGEGGSELTRASPEGVCANRGGHGGHHGLVRCGGLAIIADSPQVEEEARYEPVGHLRQHERERRQKKRTLTSTPHPIPH